MSAVLELRQVSKSYGEGHTLVQAIVDVDLVGTRRRAGGRHGSERVRQEHAADDRRDTRGGDVGTGPRRRARRLEHVGQRPGSAAAAIDRLRLPVVQPVGRPHGHRERLAAARARWHSGRPGRDPGPRRHWTGSASPTEPTTSRTNSPGARPNGSRSPGPSSESVGCVLADEPTGALDTTQRRVGDAAAACGLPRRGGRRGGDTRRSVGVLGRPGGVRPGRPGGRPHLVAGRGRVAPCAESMTITEERQRVPDREFAGDGGVPARRAVVRWAWRMVRREWRAQILVFALLSIAVAAAIWGSTAAYNLTPSGDNAEFGSANHWLQFDSPDPAQHADRHRGRQDVVRSRRRDHAAGHHRPRPLRSARAPKPGPRTARTGSRCSP